MRPRRTAETERRREIEEAAREEPTRVRPEAAVLALQRSAGNAAVARWLRRTSPVVARRDRNVPDDADSLADLGDTARELIVDDATVAMSGLPFHFKNPRVPAKAGLTVTTAFGGDMAAKPDAEKEKRVRDGLGTVGMMIFGLDGDRPKSKDDMPDTPRSGAKRRPPTGDLVHIRDLDLTSYGGKDGRYRFTAVIRRQSRGRLQEVDLIVELLGARRQGLKAWADLDAATRKRLEDRFRRFGFVKREVRDDDKDAALPWKEDDFGKVLQALELIPDDMLAGVQGITWVRGHQPSAPQGEAGFYETKTGLARGEKPERTLTVRGDAFASDDSLIRLVAHEIGHAVSGKPAETGGRALAAETGAGSFQAAATADSALAVTKYGQTGGAAESYAEAYSMFIAEPDTLKLLRPRTYEWFVRQQAAARPPARTPPAARAGRR